MVLTATPERVGGAIRATPELWIATQDNDLVDDITAYLVSGTVEMNVDRDIVMSCDIRIRNPDQISPYAEYLAPRMRYDYEDGSASVIQQLGLYGVVIPPGDFTPAKSEATFQGQGLTADLAAATINDTMNFAAATNLRTALISVITDGGISATRINMPASTVTLAAAKSLIPPLTNLEGANQFADMLGWYHLNSDLQGNIVSAGEVVELANQTPYVTYTADDMRSPAFSVTPSDLQVVNVVTVVNETNSAAPMVAIARNDNPNSPTGTPNIGERSYPGGPIMVTGETTQAALNRIARLYLAAGKSYYRTGTFSVLPDPQLLNAHQSIELDLTGQMESLSGRWAIRNARMGFQPNNALVTLEVSQTRRFDGQAI
jgi:hypothetical protein